LFLRCDGFILFRLFRQLVEERILHQMLRQTLLEFQARQLQQLDRLLQLRRHDQFLTETEIETKLHRIRRTVTE
jgi:hypothetical protein